MRENTRIVIVGGGIGGFTAALSLLQRGFSVEILERAAELGEVGAGVQNSPNAVRVLDALGLMPEVKKYWFVPHERELRLWDTGEGSSRPTPSADLIAAYGFPHANMHRADLHGILVDAVKKQPRSKIRLGATCIGFEQDADGVTALLEGGDRVRGNVLVAADGIHSLIRGKLFGASKARFTDAIAWRGLIPIERLPDYMRNRKGETWIGIDGHVTCYTVRRGELLNVVAHVDRGDWKVESWIERGDTEEFARDFAGWHEEIQIMIRNIDTPYKWALYIHDTLPRWSVGRVTLLGDAAHSMLPYLGQGANMAIEDGYVLGRAIDEFADDIPRALRAYEEERVPRTTRVVDMSAANRERFRIPPGSSTAEARKYISSAWEEQMDLRRWIYAYDAVGVRLGEAGKVPA